VINGIVAKEKVVIKAGRSNKLHTTVNKTTSSEVTGRVCLAPFTMYSFHSLTFLLFSSFYSLSTVIFVFMFEDFQVLCFC